MKARFEKVRAGVESSITAFHFEGDRFDAPWHFHPQHELTYIVRSKGLRYVGNSITPFVEGDFAWIGSNVPHCWKNEVGGSKAHSIVIQWNGDLFDHLPEFENIRQLAQKACKGVLIAPGRSAPYQVLMENVANSRGMERYLHFISLLHQLAAEKHTVPISTVEHREQPDASVSQRLGVINEYISQHFAGKVTLEEAAATACLSPASFSRFFSNTMRKPFFRYLNEYRINRARTLLIETDKAVAAIAYECGYESLPFFYKQFKRYTDQSPLQYRKRFEEFSR